MKWGAKPVIVMGHGIRASGADPVPLLTLGVPVLSSWQAADLVDNRDPMYFGRLGIYGQRCANRILYEADQVVAIGCRMTPWMIGHAGLRPEQELVLVDVDRHEAARFPQAKWVGGDAKDFIATLPVFVPYDWRFQCSTWRRQYPWVESPGHDDSFGFINSYRLMERLEPLLRPDEIIVVDVGCLMCPPFQALHVKPPQRLITSGGLGEMGCAVPMAVGISVNGRRQVLCLVGDGGLMMNLQELQTVVHNNLPVKIVVFANDGYAMIKGTHKNLRFPYIGVDKASGVSMPDFHRLANGFGIAARDAHNWNDVRIALPELMNYEGPALLQVSIDPEQAYVPRLQPKIDADGKITPALFHELSPLPCAA